MLLICLFFIVLLSNYPARNGKFTILNLRSIQPLNDGLRQRYRIIKTNKILMSSCLTLSKTVVCFTVYTLLYRYMVNVRRTLMTWLSDCSLCLTITMATHPAGCSSPAQRAVCCGKSTTRGVTEMLWDSGKGVISMLSRSKPVNELRKTIKIVKQEHKS